MKTCKKFVCHPREARTLTRLDIMVMYTFFKILKNIKFQLKN
jgi:hypothetical protein